MSAKDTWTPYGLEAIRVAYLRRRRLYSLLIGLGLCAIWAFLFTTTTETQTDIFVNGRNQNSIEIDIPNQDREDGPVTVAVEPGRVTRAASGEAPGEGDRTNRVSAPVFQRQAPIPYQLYIFLYGPYLLLAAALYFLAKKRGKHDQVNYGIYKGAMPLEAISTSMAQHIFTTKKAKSGLFGKRRADHLPEEVLRVERVQEEEA